MVVRRASDVVSFSISIAINFTRERVSLLWRWSRPWNYCNSTFFLSLPHSLMTVLKNKWFEQSFESLQLKCKLTLQLIFTTRVSSIYRQCESLRGNGNAIFTTFCDVIFIILWIMSKSCSDLISTAAGQVIFRRNLFLNEHTRVSKILSD